MGFWQDRLDVIYQNYLHPIDTQVNTTVSTNSFGQGYELANTMNLIPSRPGRFLSGADQRGRADRKIIRYELPRVLTIDCLGLVNVHSNQTLPGNVGEIDTERVPIVELFHGQGTSPYGQDGAGTGSPGTAIGSTFSMTATEVAKYGSNLFYRFSPVNAQYLTLRFSVAGANISSLSVGNVLIGRYFSFPVGGMSDDGWMLLAPSRKRVENTAVRTGRAFGAVQIETRYPAVRSWDIPTVWSSEDDRENFESYWSNRQPPRMDGVQNQHLKKRLDLPTVIMPPWQWAGTSSSYGYPIFGTLGTDFVAEYDGLGNAITNVTVSEIP